MSSEVEAIDWEAVAKALGVPLSTLPVLEAAARLSSFSAAAEELHVTHGAISHQIRSLEEYLGLPVFARIGRRVELTPEGAALAEQVRAALQQVADAVEAISPEAREHKLVISVLPSFASRWLAILNRKAARWFPALLTWPTRNRPI